jgi:hypothetical protein
MIIGGIAVVARGVPRLTDDIDATVWGEGIDLAQLLRLFQKESIEPRIDDPVAFAERNQILLLSHAPSGIDLDVSLAWLPFESEALDKAEVLDLGSTSAPVARSEDLIVYKAVAWRPQDQTDIARLLELHGRDIDLGRVRARVLEFAEALDEPGRVVEFERLVEKQSRHT